MSIFDQRPVVGQERVWVCFETGWPAACHVPNDPEHPYAYPVHEYLRADLHEAEVATLKAHVARLVEAGDAQAIFWPGHTHGMMGKSLAHKCERCDLIAAWTDAKAPREEGKS